MSQEANTVGLSEAEIAQLKKYLAQFEKNARSWRWARWIVLVASAALFISLAWHWQTAKEAYDLNESVGLPSDLTPNSEIFERFINVKIELLRTEFDHSLLVILLVIINGCLFGIITARWRQGQRNELFAKCANIVLVSLQEYGQSNKSSNTDAGDAGAG